MIVWVVERQGVEDAYLVDIFATEKLAEDFVKEENFPHLYDITDWEVQQTKE
jgi:hypothetical protein